MPRQSTHLRRVSFIHSTTLLAVTDVDDLDRWVDRYAAAIRERAPERVVACYHPQAEIDVHGLADAGSAWNSKHSVGTDGILEEYERFFALVDDFTVAYTDRIYDTNARSVAVIVRISGSNSDGTSFDRANALHLTFDDAGLITTMHNWYGDA